MYMIYGRSYDGSENVFLGAYENLRVVKLRLSFVQLAESLDLSELRSWTREILQRL